MAQTADKAGIPDANKHLKDIGIAFAIILFLAFLVLSSYNQPKPQAANYQNQPQQDSYGGSANSNLEDLARKNYSPGGAFAILEHSQNSQTGALTVVLQNVRAEPAQLEQLYFEGQGAKGVLNVEPGKGYFAAGDKKTIGVPFNSICTSGATYEYGVAISFSRPDTGDKFTQYGAKTLVGKCS